MRPALGRDIPLSGVVLAAACVLTSLLGAGCRGGEGGGLTLAGSTSVQPIAELLGEHYMATHRGSVINVQGGGSSAGIQAALSGAADIGMSSRNLKPEETGLQATVMARDAIVLVVNRDNPVRALTTEQVRGIFSGRTRAWAEVGGTGRRLTFITREEGSGTRGAFEDLVMKKEEISSDAIVEDSTGAARAIVESDPQAIAYISFGMVTPGIVPLTLDGVTPSAEAVHSGRYHLARPFLLLTRGAPSGPAAAFIEYVLSPEAQALVTQEGYVQARPAGSGR